MYSAILIAANNGHHEVVEVLLEKGSRMEDTSNNGKTPLHWACHWGHFSVIRLLIDKGANISTRDVMLMTPLMTATLQSHVGIVRYLLTKGADLTSENVYNATALMIAQNKKDGILISLLESFHPKHKKSSDVSVQENHHNNNRIFQIDYSFLEEMDNESSPFILLCKIILREIIIFINVSIEELISMAKEYQTIYLILTSFICSLGSIVKDYLQQNQVQEL
jgi:ankyrin repeat protein